MFFSIPFDQAHEQENRIVKSSGGVVGITNNPAALRRLMLSGPELARCVNEFQDEYFNQDGEHQNIHHDQAHSIQATFQKQVINLAEAITRMVNPFLDDFQDLVNLENRNCLDESAVMDLNVLETTGKELTHSLILACLCGRCLPNQPSKHLPLLGFSASFCRAHR